jgi:hypothetical protein
MLSHIKIGRLIVDALHATGGQADMADICRFIWDKHEALLRNAGRQFYTWQQDVEAVLRSLERKGRVCPVFAHGAVAHWTLVDELTNPFDALCQVASNENWPWHIGHLGKDRFLSGLLQIGIGHHPQSDEWAAFRASALEVFHTPEFFSFMDWPAPVKQHLLSVLGSASLHLIARNTSTPAWLGYLGLTLDCTSQDRHATESLTHSWLPQLRRMFDQPSNSRDRLDDIVEQRRHLSISDIDGLERDWPISQRLRSTEAEY